MILKNYEFKVKRNLIWRLAQIFQMLAENLFLNTKIIGA